MKIRFLMRVVAGAMLSLFGLAPAAAQARPVRSCGLEVRAGTQIRVRATRNVGCLSARSIALRWASPECFAGLVPHGCRVSGFQCHGRVYGPPRNVAVGRCKRGGRFVVTRAKLLGAAISPPGGPSGLVSPVVLPPLFAPSSVWNARVPADAPLDANSANAVAELQLDRSQTTAWINTTEYSSPIYTVSPAAPTSLVRLDRSDASDLAAAFGSVPIPLGARPARGSDAAMVVWQPSSDMMWEFFGMSRQANGWHAKWGGRMLNVSRDPGYYRDLEGAQASMREHRNWGATASSLPLAAGMMMIAELRRGRIDHALQIAIPHARSGVWSWPAQRTDGTFPAPTAIPEGGHFRLDPALDLASLSLPRATRMIAEAAQRYGIIVVDTSSDVSFRAEDPTPLGTDPYPDLLGHQSPNQVLASFPWDHLQLLRTDLHSAFG